MISAGGWLDVQTWFGGLTGTIPVSVMAAIAPTVRVVGMLILSFFPLAMSWRTARSGGWLGTLTLVVVTLWLHLFSSQTQVFTPPLIFLGLLPTGLCCLVASVPLIRDRVTLVTGTRSLIVLSIAMIGWVLIGPLELFFPAGALIREGGVPPGISVLVIVTLLVFLISLTRRPQFTVFHADPTTLVPMMRRVAVSLDSPTSRVSDDFVATATEDIPSLPNHSSSSSETPTSISTQRLHLWIESQPSHAQVTGSAADMQVDRRLWNRFVRSLRMELCGAVLAIPDRSAYAARLFGLGLVLIWFAAMTFAAAPRENFSAMGEFLRDWFAV